MKKGPALWAKKCLSGSSAPPAGAARLDPAVLLPVF
jgi:hypothetical protein